MSGERKAAQGAEQTNQFETLVRDLFELVPPDTLKDALESSIGLGVRYDEHSPNVSENLHRLHIFVDDCKRLIPYYQGGTIDID
jgi:hypothetical protein